MGPFLLSAVGILLATQATPATSVTPVTVAGTVRDARTGEPIAGAVVALPDLNRATSAAADGRYAFRQVPAGPQHITVRFLGYAPRTLHALVPRDGRVEIDVTLRPEPLRLPTIGVRPAVTVRGVEGGDSTVFPDRGSSIAAVRNHPLLAEPDALQALAGGEVVVMPESPSGVHIRGGASDQTAYLLDGVPVFSPYHAAGVFSAWNPDALAALRVSAAAPSPGDPSALSGIVMADTRQPGPRLQTQGTLSTTQGRLTLDGPVGAGGGGFLVSLRRGLPSMGASAHEASHLGADIGDWLAKVEAPALGGQARLLGYDNRNRISAAAAAQPDAAPHPDPRRNIFAWHSRSLGAEWRRVSSATTVRVLAWSARADAGSAWATRSARLEMQADRRDEGLLASVEHHTARATTVVGTRLEGSRTSYRIESDRAGTPFPRLSARTPAATAFAHHARSIGRRVSLDLGTSLVAAGGGRHLGPRAQLRWRAWEQLTLSGAYARTHQFAQSVRNAESVVGNVFPADIFLGAGAPGVPVARSDQGVIAADYRPLAGVRVGVQAYQRRSNGLLLVAPRDSEPFTTGALAAGSGASRGLSVDVAATTARMGVVASYGLQRVRIDHGGASYVPEHGARHRFEGGVIVFPTATSSIRLGGTGIVGRRTTPASGSLEWEACNLLDQGCEFGGSPYHGDEPLGATTLPPYVRADLSVRKHWHLELGGRSALVALFGTVVNVLDRRNLLTYARDPSTGQLDDVVMLRMTPLVVGLDWRY